MIPCYVYMIVAVDAPVKKDCAMFKVGISENPKTRMATFQTANPFKLRLLKTWRLPSREDALCVEKRFHVAHINSRLNGEWFHSHVSSVHFLEYEIVYQLAEICKVGTDQALIHALIFAGLSEEEAIHSQLAVYGEAA